MHDAERVEPCGWAQVSWGSALRQQPPALARLDSRRAGTPAAGVLKSSMYRPGSWPYADVARPYCSAKAWTTARCSRGMADRLCLQGRREGEGGAGGGWGAALHLLCAANVRQQSTHTPGTQQQRRRRPSPLGRPVCDESCQLALQALDEPGVLLRRRQQGAAEGGLPGWGRQTGWQVGCRAVHGAGPHRRAGVTPSGQQTVSSSPAAPRPQLASHLTL